MMNILSLHSLLRYFLLLGLSVPDSALKIFKQAEVFRQWTGNLTLIVNMYNGMILSLLPVEEPLVKGHLEKIDKIIRKGIEQMNWKSNGIDLFIQEVMACVKNADTILSSLKTNLSSAEEAMEAWVQTAIFQRSAKPVTVADFAQTHKKGLSHRYPEIKEGGHTLHSLLKDTCKTLKVSQGQPDWKAYVDFVNNTVVEGLASVVSLSLQALCDAVGTRADVGRQERYLPSRHV